ncbi:hypothetical protein IFM89_029220 [Coptis chinensis]|uniref:Uncharacterized protein n=1 Tax=Coptis chinensis TaxID=261450 RepID=A0A835M7D9_9MAGN|nr:hypothetical protein IFM89_029220 [Coptis chinensis]
MAFRGSLSRSLLSTARSASFRSSAPRLRPSPRFQTRRFSTTNPRTFGELGAAQSLILPLQYVVFAPCLTSHLTVNARACCELSHGNVDWLDGGHQDCKVCLGILVTHCLCLCLDALQILQSMTPNYCNDTTKCGWKVPLLRA